MALSNWATYAVEFDILATTLASTDPRVSSKAKAIDAEIDEMAKSAWAKEEHEKLFNDEAFGLLVDASHQARTIYTPSFKDYNGTLTTDKDWIIRLYKNWIYVGSTARHLGDKSGKERFTNNTLMQIQEGEMQIGTTEIYAIRGPQDGVYLVALENSYDREAGAKRIRGLVGCGLYGYSDDEYIGVSEEAFEYLTDFAIRTEPALSSVLVAKASFNQGDEFFAKEFGIETSKMNPGQKHRPMIEDVIDGLDKRFE